ncbi:Uma2 family endonuclease [Streptomyces scopuliridis]|uniref:Uma2 family endonuclease n=1 Tax=Streptomyces scopuliridis TaxID=452529 RepID=A0ACD4ZNN6_9ACTN|nr:Uma2 family endonuclease [Streptomyces scopuliridis]WSB99411.1 Uma2 family endonuclease [Streptomyces scopuliridis]WSC06888.1 Uma2 family endonuclease [Streptomyces scopuliridis]
MTPRTVRRAQMSIEDFEQVARTAPETVKFEFINGRIEVKPMPDQLHKAMVMWFLRQCMQHRPELALYPEQGLVTETYRNGRARPDGALAPLDHFAGHGEWAPADGVLMTVEVTSHDRDTDLRDRVEKRGRYAATGIPVYLLVDRDAEKLVVYTDPYKGEYQNRASHAYGATVKLPHPVSITLETEKLKDYTR